MLLCMRDYATKAITACWLALHLFLHLPARLQCTLSVCYQEHCSVTPTQRLSCGESGMLAPRLEQRARSLRQRERVRALLLDPRTPPSQRAAVRAIAGHHIAWQFAFEAALNAHVAGARLALRANRLRSNGRWRFPPALGLQSF